MTTEETETKMKNKKKSPSKSRETHVPEINASKATTAARPPNCGIQWPAEWDHAEGWPTDPAQVPLLEGLDLAVVEGACVRLGKPRKTSGTEGGGR